MGHTASSVTAALRGCALVYYWKQVHDGVRPSLVGPPGPDALLRRDPRFARSSFQTAGEDFDRRTIWSADVLHRTPHRGMFLVYRQWLDRFRHRAGFRGSEGHTSELPALMRNSDS